MKPDKTRLQNDLAYFKQTFKDLSYLDFSGRKDLFAALTEDCSIEVAKYVFNRFKVDIKSCSHPKWGNLFTLLMMKMSTQPNSTYEDIIRLLILNSKIDPNINKLERVIVWLLENNQSFKESFINDKKFLPFFSPDFFDSMETFIKENHKNEELLSILEQVKRYPLTQKMIRDELILAFNFPPTLSDEMEDILSIANFLSDKNAVINQLKLLEEELKEKAIANSLYDEEAKALKHKEPEHPFKQNRFLTSFLSEYLKKENINLNVKIFGALDDKQFSDIFLKGSLPIDSFFRKENTHGDVMHIFQIILALKALKSSLRCTPKHLIEWFGLQFANKNTLIWDATFEGVGPISLYNNGNDDFRSVTNFSFLLISDEGKKICPLISHLTEGRLNKPVSENERQHLKNSATHPFIFKKY